MLLPSRTPAQIWKPVYSSVLFTLFTLTCILTALPGYAEFSKGDKVWSKHLETALLSEPSPLAATQAVVGFAEKLSVKEARGAWLRVKADDAEGWVFSGNVAPEKPKLAPAAGFTTLDASQTNTVAAARPLTPAGEQYAQNLGAGDAKADIDWLDAESATLTALDLTSYMTENKKGDYQE